MKSNYSYEDVMKKAAAYGLLADMSDADRNLTMRNPDAGMTVLESRADYWNAATDDARALAHLRAENARKQYGGYSGGVDGSRFYVTDISPMHYSETEAPSFFDAYGQDQAGVLERILNRDPYRSEQAESQKELLSQLEAAAKGDLSRDAAFQSYAKQYRREGQRASADALGNAAATTGGIPSSAAVTAASQAGDLYAGKLADKLPELAEARQALLLNALNANQAAEDAAYQRYLNDVAMDYDRLDSLRALRNDDYVQYRDALAQYNTDRDFDYNQFVDDIQYQNSLEQARLAQKNYENELELEKGQYNDALSKENQEMLWTAALYAMENFGDSSLLKKLIERAKGTLA